MDDLDLDALPPDWGAMKDETFQLWLAAEICSEPSEEQAARYTARRRMLEELGRRLERAKLTEQIGTILKPFRGWRSVSEEWPSGSECGGCAELRSSTTRVVDIASRWPVQMSSTLGALLKNAIQHEDLIAELCAAKPSPSARAEIEGKFQYYSWTSSAARLFQVAALFENPQIVAECRGR
ncbi:MAG TPA: hypothetical protein VN493_19415 [Thermoanaerobaculia bacterium]|nr:hypothetical protein [Thermoanaerobaculia bacterium]